MPLGTCVSIISLNINGLNAPTKRHTLAEWIQKQDSLLIIYRSPAQFGFLREVLRAGALGRPRGTGWGGRWEEGSGWGIHVNPWLIHVNVWQKPLQYCKVISLQPIKINGKINKIKFKKKQDSYLYCLWRPTSDVEKHT